MKKLLLLLLLPLFAKAKAQGPDITLAGGVSSSCNTGGVASATFTSFNFITGTVYLLVVWTDSSANHPTSITGTGQSWDVVSSSGNASRMIDVYRTACTSSHTDDFVIHWTGFNMGERARVFQISGVPITNNGADAIIQTNTDANTSANPSVTLSSSLSPVSGVIGIFSRQNDIFSGTPESGWTEGYDAGCTAGSYTNGYYLTYKRNAGTDNSASVTASGSIPWIGLAIEVIGHRRIYNNH